MYPSGDLAELAARKSILQARIAVRRWECAVAAAELARPVAVVDRGVQMWHRIAPFLKFLAIPGGFLFARGLRRRGGARRPARKGRLATILSMLPVVMRGTKMVMEMRAAHAARTTSASRMAPRNAAPRTR